MIILFFGDLVGRLGRVGLAKVLPELKNEIKPDLIVANIDNLAHGKGLTAKTMREMVALGIDCFTSGNHTWKKEEPLIAARDSAANLVLPANDLRVKTSERYKILTTSEGEKVALVNLLGRVNMGDQTVTCPFKEADKLLEEIQDVPVIVDFHAETTSEKVALGWYLAGRAAAVLGTHTHIQTADERILPGGTAYITDVGMVGPGDSVLGVNKDTIIKKFLTDGPIIFDLPESGPVEINGVVIDLDATTGKATAIARIRRNVII